MTRDNIEKTLLALDIEPLGVNTKGWVLARCPFAEWTHQSGEDRNPDFWVKSEESSHSGFHCFSCGQKGPVHALVKRLEYRRGVSYGTLYAETALLDSDGQMEGYEVVPQDDVDPTPINMEIYGFASAWSIPVAREYLIQRGISESTVDLLELKFDPESKRIVFPVKDDKNKCYGFTGRTILGSEYKVPKVKDYAGLRKERFLLGEQLCKPGRPFWIVEGLFALAKMIELGLHHKFNVVAIMGASMSRYQRDIILYYNTPVYMCLDDDMGGTQGLFGAWNEKLGKFTGGGVIDQLKGKITLMLPIYPEGKDDPDNLTAKDLEFMSNNVKLF